MRDSVNAVSDVLAVPISTVPIPDLSRYGDASSADRRCQSGDGDPSCECPRLCESENQGGHESCDRQGTDYLSDEHPAKHKAAAGSPQPYFIARVALRQIAGRPAELSPTRPADSIDRDSLALLRKPQLAQGSVGGWLRNPVPRL